jgi:hypothetical protein
MWVDDLNLRTGSPSLSKGPRQKCPLLIDRKQRRLGPERAPRRLLAWPAGERQTAG